jgi:hypothetical protein
LLLKGQNLGTREVEFDYLSNFNWGDNEEEKEIISYIEKLYFYFFNKKDISNIKKMDIDQSGKIIIRPGMVNHRCSCDLNTLKYISKYGVLASEWFGILEDENEGRFCAFVSKTKNENYPYRGDLAEDNKSRLNIGKNILLFFDETNPIMKELLHLDYFEYEKNKNENKENLKNIYSKEEIEMFDKLIEPLSPAGKNMRKNYEYKTNYWSAIPGGIPPYLINGICIKNNELNDETITEISKLFPNATIFKANLDIVRYPYCETLENNKIK